MFRIAVVLALQAIPCAFGEAPPTLTWVYWDNAEPICWQEDGVPKGLEVEIAEKVLSRLGIKVKHEFYPWARAQMMVENGQADMMMTTPNDVRFKYAIFGKEMTLPNYWTLYVRKDNKALIQKAQGFTKLEDLKPYTLADFLGNGWQATFMKAEDGYQITTSVSSLAMLPQMLTHNRVQMVINSENYMDWWAEKQKVADQLEKIDIVLPHTRFHYVAMVSRKSPWASKGIIRAFDEELKKLKQSGEWQQILRKYREPYGLGKPFKTQIDDAKYLSNYDSYPLYRPAPQ